MYQFPYGKGKNLNKTIMVYDLETYQFPYGKGKCYNMNNTKNTKNTKRKYQFPYGKGKPTEPTTEPETTEHTGINSRMGKVRTVFCDTIEIIRFILYIVNIITKNHSNFPVVH